MLFSRENWIALARPFADQTRAQITWDSDAVESWRIVGYENRVTADQDFTQARKEFAEIPSGAATTVFYELRPAARPRFGDIVDLGDVELRWVTPISNDSNRQHAQIAGRYDLPSNDTIGALLQFGAVVALAADRYSSLPYPDAPYDVQYDLSILMDELREVEQQIGQSCRLSGLPLRIGLGYRPNAPEGPVRIQSLINGGHASSQVWDTPATPVRAGESASALSRATTPADVPEMTRPVCSRTGPQAGKAGRHVP